MIVAERFVFVHLHTCGGDLVNDFLLRFVPGARAIGRHLPRRLGPPPLAHLPTLGFVRNPWSYYVLWYATQSQRREPGILFRRMSDDGRRGFEPTIRNMLALGVDGDLLDALAAALPRRYTGKGLNLPGFALEPIRGSGLGFFSFLYRHMYDAPGIRQIGRVERLWDELIPMLIAAGQPVGAAIRAHVQDAPRPRAVDYAGHYGATLRDLIAERDAEIIARHGYRFGE